MSEIIPDTSNKPAISDQTEKSATLLLEAAENFENKIAPLNRAYQPFTDFIDELLSKTGEGGLLGAEYGSQIMDVWMNRKFDNDEFPRYTYNIRFTRFYQDSTTRIVGTTGGSQTISIWFSKEGELYYKPYADANYRSATYKETFDKIIESIAEETPRFARQAAEIIQEKGYPDFSDALKAQDELRARYENAQRKKQEALAATQNAQGKPKKRFGIF